MSFDESGYILYPRTSQTQQVPAYNFQLLIPGWRSSVPKYPSLPNDTQSRVVPRRPTDAKTVVARKEEIRTIFSETDERFNTVRDERIHPLELGGVADHVVEPRGLVTNSKYP